MSVTNDNDANQLGYESRTFNGSETPERRGFNFYADMTSGNNQWEFWAGAHTSWSAAKSAVGSITLNQPDLLTMFVDGGNGAGGTVTAQTLRVDGTVVQTLTPAYYKTHAGLTNGDEPQNIGTLNTSSAPLIGKIAEIIQFNRHLQPVEIAQWEGYLATKYNISGPPKWKSSNPYFSDAYNTNGNNTDKEVSFLIRPIRVINKYNVRMGEMTALSSSSPQYRANNGYSSYFASTIGGKYGTFAYNMPNARASEGFYLRATNPDTNPPYAPITSHIEIDGIDTELGHHFQYLDYTAIEYTNPLDNTKIPSLKNDINTVIISENTLQHYRADASRRRTEVEDGTNITRKDYTVEPRFSQSLHPKGHKNDVSFNIGDHTGDGS